MEVVKLNTYIVATPKPHIGGMYWIFLSIETRCGITGIGEVYSASFHPEVVVKAIEDVFERYLKGHDPHHIERFYRECFSSGFTQRPDLTMMGVLSGLEIACWDVIGKAANKPIYELIGGKVHNKLRSYTYLYPEDKNGVLNYEDPELGTKSAIKFMEQGFTALKFDPAGPYSIYSGHQISLSRLNHCENYCREVREAVGDRCDILIGTHGQLTPASAIRLAKRLEKFDPVWFEEPVPPGQSGAMAEGGEVFVLDMGEPVRIYDLAVKMIKLSGLELLDENNPKGDIEIQYTGLRPGEKLFEELIIDGKFSETKNKLIMRTEEEMMPWDKLEPILTEIYKNGTYTKTEELYKLVTKIVPEFKSN